MVDNQKLREKTEQFVVSTAGYRNTRKLFWVCGLGLWALACAVGSVVLSVFVLPKTTTFNILDAAFGVSQIALIVIVAVACLKTCSINDKIRKKMRGFIAEMSDKGYSYDSIGEELSETFSNNNVKECLFRVFKDSKDKTSNDKREKLDALCTDIDDYVQRRRSIYRYWLGICCVIMAIVIVFILCGYLSSLTSRASWTASASLTASLGMYLPVPLTVALIIITSPIVAISQYKVSARRYERLGDFVLEMKDDGCSRDKIRKYLEWYPVDGEVDECLGQAFDDSEAE